MPRDLRNLFKRIRKGARAFLGSSYLLKDVAVPESRTATMPTGFHQDCFDQAIGYAVQHGACLPVSDASVKLDSPRLARYDRRSRNSPSISLSRIGPDATDELMCRASGPVPLSREGETTEV